MCIRDRSWIHHNSIVPFTLHQVMKYIDRSGKVRTLIAERHPFKGADNYFTDSLLYQDSLETNEKQQPEELDSDNEAYTEPKECMWELNPLVTSTNKLDVNNTADDVSKWYINEELNLAYFFVFASDSVHQTLVQRWIMTPGWQWMLWYHCMYQWGHPQNVPRCRWCAGISIHGPSKTQRPKTNSFRKN